MLGPLPAKSGMPVVIGLKQETKDDVWEVEALYDLCFAPGREGLGACSVKAGVDPVAELSLVARGEGGVLAGAIQYWPVLVGSSKSLMRGPVAVHPTRQGEGLGGYLIRESLAIAQAGGWERVLLIGDAPYYGRFGFTRLEGVQMPPPTNADRILGRALVDEAWNGVHGRVTPCCEV